MALDLERQLLFYGAYHHNPVNVAIHITCVPIILFTFILLATNTPALIPIPEAVQVPNLPSTLGTIVTFIYCVLFILLEPFAGALFTPLLVGVTTYSNYLTSTYPSTANSWAVSLHVVAWVAQFVGHGVFEERAPALFDNLLQAWLLAPLFVWMEILFALGYRPELKARMDKQVQVEIAKFKQKEKDRSKET